MLDRQNIQARLELTGRFNNMQRLDILMHLIERDGPLCQGEHCNRMLQIPDMRIDHIIPVKANGPNNLTNYQILCHACNIRKGMNEDSLCVCTESPAKPEPSKTTENNAVITATADNGNGHAATHTTAPKVLDSAYMYAEKPVRVNINDLESDKTRTATMKKADKCKRPFNKWLDSMLDDGAAFTYDEYANAGANIFEASEATIKRYINERLDAPDCNPITGDLTLRIGPGGKLCLTYKKDHYFK